MTGIYEFSSVSYSAPPREVDGNSTRILVDASFVIPMGSFTVITGPSGAGKSTLLRHFNRLTDPTSGTIQFNGRDIQEYPVIELRRKIGWVPQVPVRFPGTVDINLRLPFTISKSHKFTGDEIEESVGELKALGLIPDEIYERKAEDISVGEAQRMNLLRALALKPDVLLLDEPTSALDPEASNALLAQIERIRIEKKLTVIMVSHRPDEVRKIGDVVLGIRNGRVRSDGFVTDEGANV